MTIKITAGITMNTGTATIEITKRTMTSEATVFKKTRDTDGVCEFSGHAEALKADNKKPGDLGRLKHT